MRKHRAPANEHPEERAEDAEDDPKDCEEGDATAAVLVRKIHAGTVPRTLAQRHVPGRSDW
ncbi:MAG: hypothetical protein ACI9HE_000251 [Planctomycetota bacterium]|jgi:hypothetical protein